MTALFIFALARVMGVRVTSWWRTPEHNAEVGGVSNSKHLSGDALDVASDTPQAFLDVCRLLGFDVLDERAKSNHWHIQSTPRAALFFWYPELANYSTTVASVQKILKGHFNANATTV